MSAAALHDLRGMLVTAGYGTRLAPLTDLLPKPAVPVGNHPLAFYALDHLARAGVREIVLNTHHLARELEASVRASAPTGLCLRFVHEPQILGTGGGIRNAWAPRANETFVVMNGKLLFAPDLGGALALHRARGALATLIVRWVSEEDPTGVVYVDGDGVVRGLPGHPVEPTSQLRRAMYTGVALLNPAVHSELPERGCLVRDGFARCIARGARIQAYVDAGEFRDVGMSLRHYLEANLALASGRTSWPGVVPTAGVGLCDATARVGPGARIVTSVVGPDAALAAGSTLERCVVWPGARVSGDHRDAILLPDGRVVRVVER